ncbi:MAG: cation-translocating P-type ATPase [Caldisericia bacterium]|nr:cation-translocating P-type ATPase [Caldisericia bacterium]
MEKIWKLKKEEIKSILKTDFEFGLSQEEAKERLKIYGFNEIPPKKPKSIFVRLYYQIKNFLVLILIFSAIISLILGELIDSLAIIAIVIINAFIGIYQEINAEKSLKALKELSSPTSKVIRDGKIIQIKTREIVPGDIVVLETGDKVGADLRVIEQKNLRVEEAFLTGESFPVDKTQEEIEKDDLPIHDRKNIVFSGSTVVYGRGKGVVFATGVNTEIGKIGKILEEIEEEKTPLEIKLDQLGKSLGQLFLLACLGIFVLSVIRGLPFITSFMTAVALAVAAVPEGLPAVVTIVLALGVKAMAIKKAIVRNLSSVETLGSVTTILSDKTGTLTKNELNVVKEVILGPKDFFYLAIVLCNDAKIQEGERDFGDPTEVALLKHAVKNGFVKEDLEKRFIRIDEIQFDSDRKLMSTINSDGENKYVFTKGAPEILLNRCEFYHDGIEIKPIEEIINDILIENEKMGKEGLRVLGVAYKRLVNEKREDYEKDLIFLGLIAMEDSPREEVYKAIENSKRAGIKVKMVTGDHKITAISIGKKLKIINDDNEAIDEKELNNEENLIEIINKKNVFARVSPHTKLKIVEELKNLGEKVAVTGDGINDALALKKADVGIAMGITGTDVSKEASDIVLTDDNFATIVEAIREGRRIYSNIKKVVMFLLSCNIGEVLIILFATIMNLPIPFKPIHLLYLNLISDAFPALALGVEPEEEGIMDLPPRKPNEKILNRGNLIGILASALVEALITLFTFINILKSGGTLEQAQTGALITLIIAELIRAYANKTEFKPIKLKNIFNNKFLNYSVFISIALSLLIIYVPIFDKVFSLTPLKPIFFEYFPFSFLPAITFEFIKYLQSKKLFKENFK